MRKQGFTLIELMVVVLIVAVLAAILVPMMTARLESARWSEGKAGAGSLATSIRAMAAEMGDEMESEFPTGTTDPLDFLTAQDLLGRYFDDSCYVLSNVDITPDGTYPCTYTITVSPPSGTAPGADMTWKEQGYTLDHTGTWKKIAAAP